MEVSGQRHAPAALPPKMTGTQFKEGLVSPKAGLDEYGKSSPHRDSIPGPSNPQQVAITTELSQPTAHKHLVGHADILNGQMGTMGREKRHELKILKRKLEKMRQEVSRGRRTMASWLQMLCLPTQQRCDGRAQSFSCNKVSRPCVQKIINVHKFHSSVIFQLT